MINGSPPNPSAPGPKDDSANRTEDEKALRDQNRELSASLEISKTATQTLATERILSDTLRKSMDILGLDVGYVRTLDKEGKNLIVRVASGLSSPEFLTSSYSLDSSEPVLGKSVFKTAKPHISTDIRKDPAFTARTMEREGLVSLAMIPIVSNENVHGFVALGSKRLHQFSDVELRLLFDFGSQLGTALANAQLFDAVQARATDLEKRVSEQSTRLERFEQLKRFFSPHLAEMILSGRNDPLELHRREITVVYLDLKGFTAFTTYFEPEEVMNVLQQYHHEMGRLVIEYGGTLQRLAGDGMMLFFNDPMEMANPTERAVRMAFAMRERMDGLSREWLRLGYQLGFGVGIAHGHATLGSIGYKEQTDYGAIGAVTNLASGLGGEAKHNQILATQRVVALLEGLVQSESAGNLTLKGFPLPVDAHTLLHLKE